MDRRQVLAGIAASAVAATLPAVVRQVTTFNVRGDPLCTELPINVSIRAATNDPMALAKEIEDIVYNVLCNQWNPTSASVADAIAKELSLPVIDTITFNTVVSPDGIQPRRLVDGRL